MDIRTAILKAADRIESNPAAYSFVRSGKPGCGSPGCLMGWIGFYAGVSEDRRNAATYASQVAQQLFGMGHWSQAVYLITSHASGYAKDAKVAARLLRAYANKYHPAPPNWQALATAPTEVTP